MARLLALGLFVMVGLLAALPVGAAHGPGQPYAPVIKPADFVARITNPYLPMPPGTTFIYEGEKDGIPAQDVTAITHDTKKIMGVTCTVVWDRAFEDGELVEQTLDWYAQDRLGNVWYFGEDAKELQNGQVVSTEGSWEAGVNGALPGIVMLAHPQVRQQYRQEYAPGVAEDMAMVVSLREAASVPYGSFRNVLLTKEWTPLSPGVVEHKYYASGVGLVRGVMVRGGSEVTELLDIITE
jgi:hypothetical protein